VEASVVNLVVNRKVRGAARKKTRRARTHFVGWKERGPKSFKTLKLLTLRYVKSKRRSRRRGEELTRRAEEQAHERDRRHGSQTGRERECAASKAKKKRERDAGVARVPGSATSRTLKELHSG